MVDDYYNLAVELHSIKEYDRAEIYYKKCLSLAKNQNDCLFNLALLYLETERPQHAKPLLEQLLTRDSKNRSVINAMGVVFSQQKEWDQALEWYEKSLSLFPWDFEALYNEALVYDAKEESLKAREILEILWERERTYRLFTLLYPYYENEENKKKIELLLQVETGGVEEKDAVEKELLNIYLENDSFEEALLLLESLYEREQNKRTEKGGEYLFLKGDLLLSLYRTQEGLTSIREAFRKGYDDRERITDLADRLAPSTRHILLQWEELYLGPADSD